MEQEGVGDRAEAGQRVRIAIGDRFVRHVSGGEDQRLARVRREQVVEWGVGEHHAEVGRARGNGWRHSRTGAPAGDNDRALAPVEERLVRGRQVDETSRCLEVTGEEGEGPVLAVLARAELGDGDLVRRQAGKMEPADPLDGEDRAGTEHHRRCGDRVRSRAVRELLSGRIRQPCSRAACGAGVWLGVKAAVVRVVVLGPARRAHLEARHRRSRTVVGDRAHDREPWAAVGAVDERVAVATIRGVEKLGEALLAGRHIRRDQRFRRATAGRGDDSEARRAQRRNIGCLDGLDARERRGVRLQAGEEMPYPLGWTLDLRLDAALVVQHPAGKPELLGEPEREGAEADALHRARHPDPRPAQRRPHQSPGAASSISSRSTW